MTRPWFSPLVLMTAGLAFAACDPYALNQDTRADLYAGYFDPSPLSGGFAAVTSRTACPKGKCYPAQMGFVKGQPIAFYGLFNFKSSDLASMDMTHPYPIKTLTSTDAYDFGSLCLPVKWDPTLSPLTDAFHRDFQYPIFGKLPIGPATVTFYPVVARHAVSQLQGNTCNDIKSYATLKNHTFGGTWNKAPDDYQMWTVVDNTAIFYNLGTNPDGSPHAVIPDAGWFNDLQISFLNSGTIPNDGMGNLVPMTGVIVNPSGSFSKPTDNNVIILPFKPGEPGYSPMVLVKNYQLQDRENPGDYTGICDGSNCGPKDVNIHMTGAGFYTLFIYIPGAQ